MRLWARNRGNPIGDGRRNARMPQYLQAEGQPGVFFDYCLTTGGPGDGPTVTGDSVNYSSVASITTAVIPAGNYQLEVFSAYSQTDPFNSPVQYQVRQDTVEIRNDLVSSRGTGVGILDAKGCYQWAQVLALAAGVHTFDVRIRVGPTAFGGQQVSARDTHLSLWRFS